MKLMSSIIFSGLVVSLAISQDKKENHIDKVHGYSVAFPGKPKLKESKQETKVGDIITSTAEWRSADDTQSLSVAVTKLPFPKEKYNSKKGLDGMAKAVAGFKTIEVKEIEFGKAKHPGRDVVSENADKKLYSRARIVFNADRMSMYQVSVIGGSKEFVHGKDVDAFLASFELAAK